MKNKFLAEEDSVKRAALVFIISKVYFTDEVAQSLRLRITAEEWNVLSSYIELIKRDPQYLPIFIMFNHLIDADFFRFTVKNKTLALDYGSAENEVASTIDLHRDRVFWDELGRDVAAIEACNVAELKQLKSIHDELIQPYQELLPESNALEDALQLFDEIKEIIKQPQKAVMTPSSARMTRKEIAEACDEFLKPSTSKINRRSSRRLSDSEDDDDCDLNDVDLDSLLSRANKKKKNPQNSRRKVSRGKKDVQRPKKVASVSQMDIDVSSSNSDSDADVNSRKTMSSVHKSVLQGMGVDKYSEKLKKCYEDD